MSEVKSTHSKHPLRPKISSVCLYGYLFRENKKKMNFPLDTMQKVKFFSVFGQTQNLKKELKFITGL